ncbi:MAG: 5-bromo-4-chloroindolyl phosphate hydrolysis family protein [Alicyclobacillus herbarius]|uniref:hypothetical protein n=1 Tax=Alicyclobacillus herbarius TaxID=122960 RepID=UPI0004125F95|nr:hypothetical protein [Alicyclobacillus herbarius]MCL6631609.1 5-bromo-4-chloroindolyl phosphate hydrolysis family protein [Alicyclobacillus herbarius]
MRLLRTVVGIFIAVVAFTVLMVIVGFILKIAVIVALLALAYYWFTRANNQRRHSRHWPRY